MTPTDDSERIRQLFLDTARVVVGAIADDAVTGAWDEPSVLEDQLVGGLAGHLARGGVWVVADYLDLEADPARPLMPTAVDYYARFADAASADEHRQIRERGARVGRVGPGALVADLTARLDTLAPRVLEAPVGREVGVAGNAVRMSLDEYLKTRLVEQVVHLDDLACSVGRDPWPLAPEAQALVLRIGTEIGSRRRGASAMIHCLYRSRLDPVLPVL